MRNTILLFLSITCIGQFATLAYAETQLANPLLIDMPDNTAKDLGLYACTDSDGVASEYCQSITDYSGFTYDPNRHQMLMFGGGHSATYRDDVDVFHFDTLTWTRAYTPTPCSQMTLSNFDVDKRAWISTGQPRSRHTYDQLVVTTNTKELLLMGGGHTEGGKCEQVSQYPAGGRVGHYNPDTKNWTFGASFQDGWTNLASAEFDPQSGLVVIVDDSSLWTYDPVTKVKVKIINHNVNNFGWTNNLVYFPPNGMMYYIARGNPTQVFEINLRRNAWGSSTITLIDGISGVIPDTQESGFAYDSYNKIIGGGIKDGKFYAFDPLAKTWTERVINTDPSGSSIGTMRFHAIDYDPVNNVFITITGPWDNVHTWAYRYASSNVAGAPNSPVNLKVNVQ